MQDLTIMADTYQIDSELSFANDYVAEALQYGALPYKSPTERKSTDFEIKADSTASQGKL